MGHNGSVARNRLIGSFQLVLLSGLGWLWAVLAAVQWCSTTPRPLKGWKMSASRLAAVDLFLKKLNVVFQVEVMPLLQSYWMAVAFLWATNAWVVRAVCRFRMWCKSSQQMQPLPLSLQMELLPHGAAATLVETAVGCKISWKMCRSFKLQIQPLLPFLQIKLLWFGVILLLAGTVVVCEISCGKWWNSRQRMLPSLQSKKMVEWLLGAGKTEVATVTGTFLQLKI